MDAASILLVLAVAGANVDSQPESIAPARHTSYFAGQGGWDTNMSSPPPAAAPTGDRYALGASGNGATVSAPPSVVDRSRAAVVESGNALRDGVEAGIESANRQLYQGGEQVIDTARDAGKQQFQGWAGATAQQAQINAPATTAAPQIANTRQQVSNPFATAPAAASSPSTPTAGKSRSGVAPPPWLGSAATDEPDWPNSEAAATATEAPRTAATGRAAVQTDGGWTSVHSSVAPPRLTPPRLVNTPEAVGPLTATPAGTAPLQPLAGPGGPNFPAAAASNPWKEHSVLAPQPQSQPVQQPPAATTAANNWDFGWDAKAASPPSQPATIGNRYDTAAITASPTASQSPGIAAPQPVNQPATPTITQAQPATTQTQGPSSPPTFGIGAWDKDGWPDTPATPQGGALAQRENAAGIVTTPGNMGSQPAPSSTVAGMIPQNGASVGMPVGATPEGTAPTLNAEQVPWMPLVVVSLALAGSIGANLFLGWSYVDARQKYRTLVQKTANKFRRAVSA